MIPLMRSSFRLWLAVSLIPTVLHSQRAATSHDFPGCYAVAWQLRLPASFPDTIELTSAPLRSPRLPYDSTRRVVREIPSPADSLGPLLYWSARGSNSLRIVQNDGYSPLIILATKSSDGWAGQAHISYDVVVDNKAQESQRVRVYGHRVSCPGATRS